MMMRGIGTDILSVQHLKMLQGKYDDPFFQKTFTRYERDQAMLRDDPIIYFATRFAAKEAVFKSLGLDGNNIRLNDIEITTKESGAPSVKLTGELSIQAKMQGVKAIQISLSWDGDYALAFAVAEG